MPTALVRDERLIADAFAAQLGPLETWYDGTFGLRPAGDRRGIRLENSVVHEAAQLRPPARARIAAAIVAAFTTCRHTVRVRLIGARTLRASQLADLDVLEVRVDEGPWAPVGEVRAA